MSGYYRFPTVHGDRVVFVSEDDLWTVPAGGGVARRLTTGLGRALQPAFSPDGEQLAFTGRNEGHPEVYTMPAEGGQPRRLTFLGADTRVVTWTPDGAGVVFASTARQPCRGMFQLYAVPAAGGEPEAQPTGPALWMSFGPEGGRVLGRHTTDLARWKRYRGGLTGELWVDPDGLGTWRRLIDLPGNLACPMWVGERVYFLSDHEGVGNLFSCTIEGQDVRRHTQHRSYYVRHPSTDGRRIVYQAGADLFLLDPAEERPPTEIHVEYHSGTTERQRKFADAARYLQGYDLHPKGTALTVTTRGKLFTFPNWDGATRQLGQPQGVRYRLAAWMHDGRRLAVVSDESGEPALEIRPVDGLGEVQELAGLDIGRPISILPSPTDDLIAVTNHRYELVLVDPASPSARILDTSGHSRIRGVAWSPDGAWIAYGIHDTRQTAVIRLAEVATGAVHTASRPVLVDVAPSFDPEGKYLYFLSYRELDPVYDNLHFDLGFPKGMRPCLVTLQADLPSPFEPDPDPDKKADGDGDAEADGDGDADAEASSGDDSGESADESAGDATNGRRNGSKDAEAKKPKPVRIDLDGIQDRVVVFPVPEGRYGRVRGLKGKVLFSSYPVEGALGNTFLGSAAPEAKGTIHAYDFADQKKTEIVKGVTSFEVSADGTSMVYRSKNRLRVLKAGSKPDDKASGHTRASGWIDLSRVKVSIEPPAEWRQMFREAWRMQRDQFWTPDMSGVDWDAVYARYLPLLQRVGTRSELSDFLWEVQGELGTSHAYEFGGDYRPEPGYYQGLLGARFAYAASAGGWRVEDITRGDPADPRASSPLARAGVDVRTGDVLLAIDGQRLSESIAPGELLVNRAKDRVELVFAAREADGEPRRIRVTTLRSEAPLHYREWVEGNRATVHEATEGRVGYIHIPDMGAHGYAEFHRGFLVELDREGLIVDVRYNGGGHVSQLLLEKLARRRIGYDVQRWGQPVPYPYEAVMGPLVALTNEAAGSDGDMFSHAFKMMSLGPLVGKRTWGGVVGINVRDSLVDGSVTTQPEFSFWFEDVGYGLENFGTEPDIEVDVAPHDYVAGRDTQLETAIATVERLLRENPPRLPDFGERPSRALPWVES